MVTVTSSSVSIEVTRTAILTAEITGLGTFNYQWQKEGRNLTGETDSKFIIYNISQSDQANYSCYVSNNYGDSTVSNIVTFQVTSMYAFNRCFEY